MARRTIVRAALGIVLVVMGTWLLLDASAFALYPADPAAGRSPGCYTALELWLGVSRPSQLRGIQALVALGMMFGPLWPIVAGARRRRRHHHMSAA